jgi:hypothetical protein
MRKKLMTAFVVLLGIWSFGSNRRAADASTVLGDGLSRRAALFANAVQANLSCPETIVVGVVNTPPGWMDYNRRVVPFENLSIVYTAQGSKISCDYDKGRYAVDRLVPGRVCTRDGETSPHMSCRTIPTKR